MLSKETSSYAKLSWETYFVALFAAGLKQARQLQIAYACITGVLAGGFVSALLLLSDHIYPFVPNLKALEIPPVLAGVFGFLIGWRQPIRRVDLALFLDKKLNLGERLLTIHSVLDKQQKDPLEQALIAQTGSLLRNKDPLKTIVLPRKRHRIAGFALLAALFLASRIPLTFLPWQKDLVETKALAPQLSRLEEQLKELEELARRSNDREVAQATKELEKLTHDLKHKRIVKKQEILVGLSTVEEHLQKASSGLEQESSPEIKRKGQQKNISGGQGKGGTADSSSVRQSAKERQQEKQYLAQGEKTVREIRNLCTGQRGGRQTANLPQNPVHPGSGSLKPISVHQKSGKGKPVDAKPDWGIGTTARETQKHQESKERTIAMNRQAKETSGRKRQYSQLYGEKRVKIPMAPVQLSGKLGHGTGVYALSESQLEKGSNPGEHERIATKSLRENSSFQGGGGFVEPGAIPPSYEPAMRAYFKNQGEQ